MTIQAIETHYAGHRFRSRLEARWAVFLDTLDIPWQYEPQGFELAPFSPEHVQRMTDERLREPQPDDAKHLGAYLPDFWLPEQAAWLEIKGPDPTAEDWARLFRFMELIENRVFVAVGSIPNPRTIGDYGHDYDEKSFEIYTYGDHHYAWTRCDSCGFYDLTFDARSARTRCGCHQKEAPGCDKCYRGDDPNIIAAYTAARSARFEHGEAGR
jgi:hypothetical protein